MAASSWGKKKKRQKDKGGFGAQTSFNLNLREQRMNRILSGEDGIQVNKNSPAQGIILIRRWILKDEDRKI